MLIHVWLSSNEILDLQRSEQNFQFNSCPERTLKISKGR
jgi:hypothetical protein